MLSDQVMYLPLSKFPGKSDEGARRRAEVSWQNGGPRTDEAVDDSRRPQLNWKAIDLSPPGNSHPFAHHLVDNGHHRALPHRTEGTLLVPTLVIAKNLREAAKAKAREAAKKGKSKEKKDKGPPKPQTQFDWTTWSRKSG